MYIVGGKNPCRVYFKLGNVFFLTWMFLKNFFYLRRCEYIRSSVVVFNSPLLLLQPKTFRIRGRDCGGDQN